MKDFFEELNVFEKSVEVEKSRKLAECSAFVGRPCQHPKDESLFVLVVSEPEEGLSYLEFSRDDLLHYELLDEKKGEYKIYVKDGGHYVQESYFTAGKGVRPEIPDIRNVFRGRGKASVLECGCSCQCDCTPGYDWTKNAGNDDTNAYWYYYK